jgi:uncharacterized protein (TIGR02145 family)
MSFSISKSIITSLGMGIISIIIFVSCDELEPVNPADPAYTLKPPTLVSAQAITDIQIDLSWQNNEEHTEEFVISRKLNNSTFTEIATVEKAVLSYTDSNCVLGTPYTYTVVSKHESNQSEKSNQWTLATVFPPPSNISVDALSDIAVQVSWRDNSTFEQGFQIERSNGASFLPLEEVSANTTSYSDSSFEYGAEHIYRVAAITESNTSFWVSSSGINIGIPVVSNLEALPLNDAQIQLSWDDNSDSEDGFKIERDSGSGFVSVGEVKNDILVFTDSQLHYGQSYRYRVASYKGNDVFGWQTTGDIYTLFPLPSNINVLPLSDSEVVINWTDNCSFEVGHYIERDSGSGFEQLSQVIDDVTTYLDTGLQYGNDYVYRVAGYTALNVSAWDISSYVNTTIQAPTSLSSIATSNTVIELRWQNNSSYEVGLRIERGSDGSFEPLIELFTDAEVFTDTALTPGRIYGYRVQAFTAEHQSEYSNVASDTALASTSIMDNEGNVYETVQIGDQVWMAENLKVTRFRNGDLIEHLEDRNQWGATQNPAYCTFNNTNANALVYGHLYNSMAVTDARQIAPEGWHVPTDEEWMELELYLGMNASDVNDTDWRGTDEGGQLKEVGTSHWADPNQGALNSFGFSALPGGYRSDPPGGGPNYSSLGGSCYFWTSSTNRRCRVLSSQNSQISRFSAEPGSGFSVRCVKD